jgi:hypothetical protein
MAGLDWEGQEKARSYARIIRPLAFSEISIPVFSIVVLLLTPLYKRLRKLLDFPQPLGVALYSATIALYYAIVLASLNFFFIERSPLPTLARERGWVHLHGKVGEKVVGY